MRSQCGSVFVMTNIPESSIYKKSSPSRAEPAGWAKLGLIAMASVVLGGMATAWWYRKTILRLRQAGENPANPQFGISESDSADEI